MPAYMRRPRNNFSMPANRGFMKRLLEIGFGSFAGQLKEDYMRYTKAVVQNFVIFASDECI